MKRAIEVIAKAQSILAFSLLCVLRAIISGSFSEWTWGWTCVLAKFAPGRPRRNEADSRLACGWLHPRAVRLGSELQGPRLGRCRAGRPGSGLQERDDGEHAPVRVGRDR